MLFLWAFVPSFQLVLDQRLGLVLSPEIADLLATTILPKRFNVPGAISPTARIRLGGVQVLHRVRFTLS
jgi:hypothetical protein